MVVGVVLGLLATLATANRGQGQAPDKVAPDKVTLQLRSRAIATKPFGYGCDPERDGVRRFDVPEPLQRSSLW